MWRSVSAWLLLALAAVTSTGCNRQHDGDAFLPSSPEFSGALVLSISASSIPADGFSRLEVTAQITGGADLNRREVRFETDNGDFPDDADGDSDLTDTDVAVNSNGQATVELRSSTSPTIATITGQVLRTTTTTGAGGSPTTTKTPIEGLITRITVEFTPADPDTILRLSASQLTGEADGASVIFVHADVSPELPITQTVEFATTLGMFLKTDGTKAATTTLPVDIGRRATATLESPGMAGEALVTAKVMNTTREIRILYDPALPEVIVVNLSKTKLERDDNDPTKERADITVILSRAEGKVTAGTAVDYSAREKDYGEPLDLLFFDQELSVINATNETAMAKVALGTVDFVGTATIRATVNGVFGEADIEIDAPAPQSDIAVDPENLAFGVVTVGMSDSQNITIENEGDDTLIVTHLSTSGGEFSIEAIPALPREVAPEDDFDITIVFAPTAAGPQSGTLRINSNDPNKPELSVSLTGEGTP